MSAQRYGFGQVPGRNKAEGLLFHGNNRQALGSRDVPLPGKTEMKKDRAHLESAIEALETAKASMKLFRKLTSVRDLPQLHKQAKALRRPLKEIRMQADDLLASWVAGVEEQKAGSRKR